MIYTVTLNPAIDKTLVIEHFAPGSVNRVLRAQSEAGGKGINVSKVLHSLGSESVAYAVIGGSSGDFVQKSLESSGISCRFLHTDGQTRTNIKIIDPVTHETTDINEPGAKLSPETLAQLKTALCDTATPEDVFVLSGSLPKGVPNDVYGKFITALRSRGASIFLDTSAQALKCGIEAAPTLVKPNIDELRALTGKELATTNAIIDEGKKLLARGIQAVVISLGAQGAIFMNRDSTWHAPALPVRVLSTVGAGDAMIAALATAFSQGLALSEAIRPAMATSAAAVECEGSQAPDKMRVAQLMQDVRFERID